MTLQQIEKIREFTERLKYTQGEKSFKEFVAELRGYFGDNFNLQLQIESSYSSKLYTDDLLAIERNKVKSFLESRIDSDIIASEVKSVLDLINEGIYLG